MKEEFIDLGLPSGNLWKIKTEEGYYTYDEAVKKFGDSLPTKEDFKELYDNCTWIWDEENKGVLFTSKENGNKLFFRAEGFNIKYSSIYTYGFYGSYWSSSPYGPNNAYILNFGSGYVNPVIYSLRNNSQSVLLVQRPNITILNK